MTTPIDDAWRAVHPLPDIGDGQDKEERGRVLLVGGSRLVPGACLLTGEAALRAGAGKVQIGTIEAAAIGLGLAFPESAVIGLPTGPDGELSIDAVAVLEEHAAACDTLVIGPGMAHRPHTCDLVLRLRDCLQRDSAVLLDAGALTAFCDRPHAVGRAVITPHHGELAALTGRDKGSIAADPEAAARDAARQLSAIVVLKAASTFVADADGQMLRFDSQAPGLGTAGSGDVLAGIIAGLMARGVAPLAAAAWGVWLHGEAGRITGDRIGRLGYLGRELLAPIPALVSSPPGKPGSRGEATAAPPHA